ncbi:hypothetical protein DE146DRAFT_671043 [Phaeosphaeria sp. MPI-PUGE-AT-0046c]|nr:hypothetical protein DE146DRAFT_671043 [Phaeosphaeria sp. MPI-PUGE-AT-0046c]
MTVDQSLNKAPRAVDGFMSEKPFQFLRLPKDIRFMVYELLQPRNNKHILLSNAPERDPHCAILVVRTMDMSMLRTCKTVNDEARGLLYKTARQLFTTCAAQIILPKGDAQENMVTTFLGAVQDSYKSLCAAHGARGIRELGEMPQHKSTYFGLTNHILIWYASRVAYVLWAGPSFKVHVVPMRRTREDFWKLDGRASRVLGAKWDKTAAYTCRNITNKVKTWVGPFDWTIEVPGVLPFGPKNMPFDTSLDRGSKRRATAPRAYGMNKDVWVACWLAT